jgi:GNAT superfamily N-acetyltransferase
LESSRPSSRLSRALPLMRRILPWPGLADMDTRQASPGATLPQGSLRSFRPVQPPSPPPSRVRPCFEAWPTTGGAVIAPLQIARASAEHLDIVLGLIEDARIWLWTKDTDQWEKPWPNPAARDARVLAGLKNGKTWIIWDGDIAAGTVTVTTKRNTAVWSKSACTADLAERAVFIHRLITSRNYAGQGLGAELIDWAGLWGDREYGAKWIRIDVWTTNTGLHDYYMNKGFRPCGTCADSEYPSGALFEKPVAEIMVPKLPKFTETPADSQATEPFANVEETAKFDLASY